MAIGGFSSFDDCYCDFNDCYCDFNWPGVSLGLWFADRVIGERRSGVVYAVAATRHGVKHYKVSRDQLHR